MGHKIVLLFSLLLCGQPTYAAEAKLYKAVKRKRDDKGEKNKKPHRSVTIQVEGECKLPHAERGVAFYSRDFENKRWDNITVKVEQVGDDEYVSYVNVVCGSDFNTETEKYNNIKKVTFTWPRQESEYDRHDQVYGVKVGGCVIAPNAKSFVVWGKRHESEDQFPGNTMAVYPLPGPDERVTRWLNLAKKIHCEREGMRPFFIEEKGIGGDPVLGLYVPGTYPPVLIEYCCAVHTGVWGRDFVRLGAERRPCEMQELNKELLNARMAGDSDERAKSSWWRAECEKEDFSCDICERQTVKVHEQCTGKKVSSLYQMLAGYIKRHDIWPKLPEKEEPKKKKRKRGQATMREKGELFESSSDEEEMMKKKKRKKKKRDSS